MSRSSRRQHRLRRDWVVGFLTGYTGPPERAADEILAALDGPLAYDDTWPSPTPRWRTVLQYAGCILVAMVLLYYVVSAATGNG